MTLTVTAHGSSKRLGGSHVDMNVRNWSLCASHALSAHSSVFTLAFRKRLGSKEVAKPFRLC